MFLHSVLMSLVKYLPEENIFQTKALEKYQAHFLCTVLFFLINHMISYKNLTLQNCFSTCTFLNFNKHESPNQIIF